MSSTFFGRPVRLFGNLAVLILCVVFFLCPFALRGARMSIDRMENNVKDWLPSEFPETVDLEWFGDHFAGERFVLITWPGCNADDERFELLVKKLRGEVIGVAAAVANGDDAATDDAATDDAATDDAATDDAATDDNVTEDSKAGESDAADAAQDERLKARKLGDRLGLFNARSYHFNWAGRDEKWLMGSDKRWYFITPAGEVYRWNGKANLPGMAYRFVQRLISGKGTADGELMATVGAPSTPRAPNEFHSDPRKITARFFKTIETGPEILEELAAEGGPLWPRLGDIADEDRPLLARKRARERLTGTLLGPAVEPGFDWELNSFRDKLSRQKLNELPADWEPQYTDFVARLVERDYGGDREALAQASLLRQSMHWDQLFFDFGVEPPPRPTCAIVTLSEAGKLDPGRVIGRPLMGKPAGKLLAIADECSIIDLENNDLSNLKLGGPPVDNVAIDEEGTITLFRLIGWSAVLGIALSYLCFRSVKITIMVFFVGGVSAVTSLSIVWWTGASVDAVLMSMPALVYVLGLSGAVHIVNYYRDAAEHQGIIGAPERALAHGWGPCTLAAFTTALGLMSLYTSNLLPIKKFGLYSALGVMATLTLLFTYLPSALQVWPPGYHRRNDGHGGAVSVGIFTHVERFWTGVGRWIIHRHAWVAGISLSLMVIFGFGLGKINTSVQLLKLFDGDAKIIRDYQWLEANFGKLVPMELVLRFKPQTLLPPDVGTADEQSDPRQQVLQHDFLERMEFTQQVQRVVEKFFGEKGEDIVGQGMSAATFAPELPPPTSRTTRLVTQRGLVEGRDRFLAEDYLAIEKETGDELWRVSLRLGALNDVDYGEFVSDLKQAVEPVLSAHKYREQIIRELQRQTADADIWDTAVFVLGVNPLTDPRAEADKQPDAEPEPARESLASGRPAEDQPLLSGDDQTQIFADMLNRLLRIEGFRTDRQHRAKLFYHDPDRISLQDISEEKWAAQLQLYNVVVLVADHPDYDLDFIRQHAKVLIDARDHRFDPASSLTAEEQDLPVKVVYTGVVPVVYKAQRTLLNSLINSIGLAFVMIAVVMMVLLRDWRSRFSLRNSVNAPAGLISMIPNVFPVVLVFGAMGHAGVLVDIGTMMTASVAMGVAVDDTIHFLTWFRIGIRDGLSRSDAMIEAYRRVATAMTQTTLIGGLGLAVFALSTFTPTQQFGVMMVTLLVAALIGDLILLPALLAGPLGSCFCPRSRKNDDAPTPTELAVPLAAAPGEPSPPQSELTPHGETVHSHSLPTDMLTNDALAQINLRRDVNHDWPRH